MQKELELDCLQTDRKMNVPTGSSVYTQYRKQAGGEARIAFSHGTVARRPYQAASGRGGGLGRSLLEHALFRLWRSATYSDSDGMVNSPISTCR